MTNELKNIPELRFPEFDGEWEINIFDDMVSNKSSKYTPNNDESIIDIELDSIQSNTGRLIKSYTSNEFSSQKNVFKKNQVLYSKLRPYLNKYHFPKFDGVCTSEIWVLDSKNKSILSNEFLYYFIQTSKFSEVTNKSAGSKMPRADWNLVGDLRLNIASIKEQDKIIRFFSKLDRQIELEEQKLGKLEEQKKGYMQKIFSQELRFKNENGNEYPEWETKNLKDIANIYQPENLAQKNFQNEGYPVYGANGVIGNYKDYNHINMEIAVACRGNTCGSVNLTKPKSWITSNAMVVNIIDKNEIEFYFLYHYLSNFDYSKVISGSGQPQITRKNMDSIDLLMPNFSNQQKIGSFFNELDYLIKNLSQKINILKQRKQGLLQKMFI